MTKGSTGNSRRRGNITAWCRYVLILVLLKGLAAVWPEPSHAFVDLSKKSAKVFFKDRTVNSDSKPGIAIMKATKSWMRRVPGHLRLSEMSIPGTHNSGTGTYPNSAFVRADAHFVRTQHWSIYKQLMAGIRFLDIRCRRAVKEQEGAPKFYLELYHGAAPLSFSFDSALEQIKLFLKRFPTETVVMRVQEERYTGRYLHQPLDKTQEEVMLRGRYVGRDGRPLSLKERIPSFHKIFESYVKDRANRGLFYKDRNYNDPEVPTLEEVRGKIVVLGAYDDFDTSVVGMRYHSGLIKHQDEYEAAWTYPTASKMEYVKETIEEAEKDQTGTDATWHINFASVSGLPWSPFRYAASINLSLSQYIDGKPLPNRLGTIVLDYPGELLIYQIIRRNFGALKPGWIEFRNDGWFVARFWLAYDYTNHKGKVIQFSDDRNFSLGFGGYWPIPPSAHNIQVSRSFYQLGHVGQNLSSLRFDRFDQPPRLFMKTWGTIVWPAPKQNDSDKGHKQISRPNSVPTKVPSDLLPDPSQGLDRILIPSNMMTAYPHDELR